MEKEVLQMRMNIFWSIKYPGVFVRNQFYIITDYCISQGSPENQNQEICMYDLL